MYGRCAMTLGMETTHTATLLHLIFKTTTPVSTARHKTSLCLLTQFFFVIERCADPQQSHSPHSLMVKVPRCNFLSRTKSDHSSKRKKKEDVRETGYRNSVSLARPTAAAPIGAPQLEVAISEVLALAQRLGRHIRIQLHFYCSTTRAEHRDKLYNA